MTPEFDDGPGAVHVPVVLSEVLEFLDLKPGLVVVDGTVGAGGHALEILKRIQPGGRLIGLDRDPMMLAHARAVLPADDADLVHASYAELNDVLSEREIAKVDRVLVDLGLSSDQLADAARGFSFDSDAGLDMRFDTSRGQSAEELINQAPTDELARIIYEYGEERHSRRIARRIVERRPIRTAAQFSDAVCSALPKGRGWSRMHPATRVFQALRIAVNNELEQLKTLLDEQLPHCLAEGGRAVVISFHSLEDRLVKQSFRDRTHWENLTRKPVTASEAEQAANPRSRSAKLRAAVWRGQGVTNPVS
jgi:16S rRNA (cytosine1402-N4)-methyltransferase